jgi:jumonji domain-containing protein 7
MPSLECSSAFEDMCRDMHRSFAPSVAIRNGCSCSEIEGVRTITPAVFIREFVACSRPCVIKEMLADWPAMQRWQDDTYLFSDTTRKVTVALTPNGRADCITDATFVESGAKRREQLFLSACDAKCTMGEVRSMMQEALRKNGARHRNPLSVDITTGAGDVPPIPYVQLQNNSMPLEFEHLLGDMSDSVSSFGADVFGVLPEATNMWVGSSLSVSSMHQDWYENLYAVIRGTKRFTLVAPWEAPRLEKMRARAASFVYSRMDGGGWSLAPALNFPEEVDVATADDGAGPPPGWVDWIGFDIEDTPAAEWPDCAAGLRHVVVDVGPGDVLYLPAMWYHRVGQAQAEGDWCVAAVNYWFDMNFESPLFEIQAMLRKAAFPPRT